MLIPIPGLQQIANYGKSKIKIVLIFEVVDDPEESVEARGYVKPINVWFAFRKEKGLKLKPADFYGGENVVFVPGITKLTAVDARKFDFASAEGDGSYLYVLAEPASGWESRYEARQFTFQVHVARTYAVAVSLKPLNADSAKTDQIEPVKKPKGFNLS
jgi:hypothetical protein